MSCIRMSDEDKMYLLAERTNTECRNDWQKNPKDIMKKRDKQDVSSKWHSGALVTYPLKSTFCNKTADQNACFMCPV